MRVLEVLPELEKGGVENYVIMLVPLLKSFGVDVIVMSNGGKLVKKLDNLGIKHILRDVKSKNILNLLSIFKLRRFLKKNNIELVHVHSRVPAWLFYPACMGICPIIMSPHGQYKNHLGSSIVKKIPYLIVGAGFLKEYFKEVFKVSEEKIFLAPYGIDSNYFIPGNHKENKDILVFGAAGRFTKLKGFDILIKAFSKIKSKDWRLFIAGSGEEESNLKKITSELGLDDRIKFLGQLEDMRDFYNSIDVFVISSHREGLPLTMLEAMACEKPVLATPVGDIPRVINDHKNGFLIYKTSVNEIKKGIENVFDSKKELIKIGKKARKTILENHGQVKNALAVFDVYKDIMYNK